MSTFLGPRSLLVRPDARYGGDAMEAGVFSVGNPANLTSLDVACGMPLGWNSSPPPRPHRSSLDEFASLLFSSSFGRGPCYMPFSGGSESSTWLAVATRYARSHGHDDPIPITLHYPGLASPEQLRTPGTRHCSTGTGGLGAGRARGRPRPDWPDRRRGAAADGPVVAAARVRDGSACSRRRAMACSCC